MNLIFLCLLPQIINFSSAAPIDFVQTDLFDALTTEANNLTKTWENVSNIAEIPLSINNFQELPEKLDNLTLAVQKNLDKNNEKNSAATSLGNTKAVDENSDNDIKNVSTPTYNPTEEISPEIALSSKGNELHSYDITTETPTPFLITTTLVIEPEIENFSVHNGKDFSTPSTSDRNTEMQETTFFATEDHTNFEPKGTDQYDHTFKQSVDPVISEALEIGDKLAFLADKSEGITTQIVTEFPEEQITTKATPPIKESFANNMKQTEKNASNQSHNLKETITENYNTNPEKSKTLQQTSNIHLNTTPNIAQTHFEEQFARTQVYDIEDMTTSSANLEINERKVSSKQNFEPTINTNLNNEDQTTIESEYSTTALPHENSSMTPNLKQAFDYFINQLSAIEHSVGTAVDEVKNNSSIEQAGIQHDETQFKVIRNETEELPSFKQAQRNTDKQVAAYNVFATEASIVKDTKLQTEVQATANKTFQLTSNTVAESFDDISLNLQATTIVNIALEEKGSESQTTPSALENLNENENTETIENDDFAILTLAHKQASNTETDRKCQLITEASDTTSNPKDSAEIPQETLQTFEEKTEISATESELNLQTANTDEPVEHAENNDQIEIERNQSEIQSLANKDDELVVKFNDGERLDLMANRVPNSKNNISGEIIYNESSQLNEGPDKYTETVNESIEKSSLMKESHQLKKESPTVPLLKNNFLTNETTEKNQHDFSTASSQEFLTSVTEFNTLAPIIETTNKARNFKDELQTALEGTTYQQLEEIQNNLKQPFEKLTASKTENSNVQANSMTSDVGFRTASLSSEELHRRGVIRQNFIDKFVDNNNENVAASTEIEYLQLQESAFNSEETTKTTEVLTTTPLSAENIQNVTILEDITENLVTTTAAKILGGENKSEAEPVTPEYISETTNLPSLVRVPLQKNFNSFTLNSALPAVTVSSIQETVTVNPEMTEVKQAHLEFFAATENTKTKEETTTLPFAESSLKEIVAFTENKEITTKSTQLLEKNYQEVPATTQRQDTQSLSNLMQYQLQHNESTTEPAAQIVPTDLSKTDTTTNQEELATERQTTEAEINTTTMVEENETTVTTTETEARSLPLTPPKLEYLQSDEVNSRRSSNVYEKDLTAD